MPNKQSATYHEHEARERAAAAASPLSQVAELHLRAARRWHELATRQERFERQH